MVREEEKLYSLNGKEIKTNNDNLNARKGVYININLLEKSGIRNSLENNLIASLKGWGTPARPTLLGPFRN